MTAAATQERDARRLSCRAEAEDYIATESFALGPPELVGAELEWLVYHSHDPRLPLDPNLLSRTLGDHTPSTLCPDSPATPLPGGSRLTLEPGGQVELSSPPLPGVGELTNALRRDQRVLQDMLARQGLTTGNLAADPHRRPRRLLRTPRYDAMEAAFDRHGSQGRVMMCTTAALQLCLDAGSASGVLLRWQAAHLLAPTLIALFANSPVLAGGPTGMASSRMSAWAQLDPIRTAPVFLGGDTDPAAEWARWSVEKPLLCIRRDNGDWCAPDGLSFADWADGRAGARPTYGDLDYHLSTLFPPVRPQGYLELRYLDAQPEQEWVAAVVLLAALFSDEVLLQRAVDCVAPAAHRWETAVRAGLSDSVLAGCAGRLVDMACRNLEPSGAPAGDRELTRNVLSEKVAAVSRFEEEQ